MSSDWRSKNKAELHRHLDVSIRPSTLLELTQNLGLESQSTSLEAFKKKWILTKPLKSLDEVIDAFTIFQKVQNNSEILERVAYEVVQEASEEGTTLLELRFSPSFVTQYSSLSWKEATDAYLRGIEKAKTKFPKTKVGLICIATREFGIDSVAETAEFYLKNLSSFIGFDLAGSEIHYPCKMFESAFTDLKKEKKNNPKIHITIHAGEVTDSQNIWEAIEYLGAERIGHGIHALDDKSLIEYLIKNKIHLEVCPLSNWLTQAVSDLQEHPLPSLLEKGVSVGINTDDPGLFGNSMLSEIDLCQNTLKMSISQIDQCLTNAIHSTFLPQ